MSENKESIINSINSFHFSKSQHPIYDKRFGHSTFFDTASIGLKSIEVEEYSPPIEWKSIVNNAKDVFAKLINADNCDISLFHNTTSAIQRVLSQLNNYNAFQGYTLMTTDVEYPGIYAAANEIWEGPICIIKLSDLIYNTQNIEENNILDRIFTAIKIVKPTVLYFSHVTRSQGYIFDIDKISSFSEKVLPYKFFIADGAQAVGNICIDLNNIPFVDAYVTSGHKWLCGPQHLGILYSKRKWRMEDPAQSYSESVKSAGTGNREVLLKFTKSLEDFFINGKPKIDKINYHNKNLSKLFSNQLSKDFEIIGGRNRPFDKLNGIVVFRPIVKVLDCEEIVIGKLEKPVSFTELHPEEVTFFPWSNYRLRYILTPDMKCELNRKLSICSQVTDKLNYINDNNSINNRQNKFIDSSFYEKISNGIFIQHTGQWYRVCLHYYHNNKQVILFANAINNSFTKKMEDLKRKNKISRK